MPMGHREARDFRIRPGVGAAQNRRSSATPTGHLTYALSFQTDRKSKGLHFLNSLIARIHVGRAKIHQTFIPAKGVGWPDAL